MTNKKKSSIDWLVEQFEKHHVKQDLKNTAVFQQAKEMHKQEIQQAYTDGLIGWDDEQTDEEYYSQTFDVT